MWRRVLDLYAVRNVSWEVTSTCIGYQDHWFLFLCAKEVGSLLIVCRGWPKRVQIVSLTSTHHACYIFSDV